MLRAFLVLAFLAMLLSSAAAKSGEPVTNFNTFTTPGLHDGTMHLDDRERHFLIYTPGKISGDKPIPIVFFFHGASGSAEQAASTYGWIEKAKAERFFIVFPDGLGRDPDKPPSIVLNPRIWRDERDAIPTLVNDTNFFSTLLDKLEEVLPIDQRRVYVTGFSNGAGMAFTLGGHFSNRIAAIAPVASQSLAPTDNLARPLPVYYLVGTADPLIPYNGGAMKIGAIQTQREMPPVADSLDRWVKLNGCPPNPQTLSDRDGVTVKRYGPGRANAEVVFTVIDGNGHHWPGSREPLPRAISGPTRDPFSATDQIWNFFRRHSLPGN